MNRHPHQWAAALLAALVGLTGFAVPERSPDVRESGSAPQGTRYSGEYGLWVQLPPDSLVVHWLTSARTAGLLEVEANGRSLLRDTTPRGRGHRVAVPRPRSDSIRLRYGAAGGETFETSIRLESPGARPDRAAGTPRRGGAVSGCDGVDSLYAVGDVHGHYDQLVELLRNAGLVDEAGDWSGGTSHLAFLGDLVDRGPDVRRTLWFVYRLQGQAARAGGRVHTLLGNHEIMVLTGDHRYVAPKERLMARLYGTSYANMYHPERSVLGRWIASWPAALRMDRVLLAHGGIGPAYRDWSVEAMNDSVRAWTREPLFRYWTDTTVAVPPMDSTAIARRTRFFFQEESPLWFRGYARTDTLGRALRRTLASHGARLHVIGHTPVPRIRHNYTDSVALVDLREPASELLLLTRSGDGYERWAIPAQGDPRRVPPENR